MGYPLGSSHGFSMRCHVGLSSGCHMGEVSCSKEMRSSLQVFTKGFFTRLASFNCLKVFQTILSFLRHC